ncbi:MAG TPA: hypothetical protein VF131_26875 [Blastocatellia bacterium]|nr:hypothetical protein [Blastocatellia bacterium]
MKNHLLRYFILLLTTACAVASQPLPVASIGPPPAPLSNKQTSNEKKIERRDRLQNGILVGEPKVFDDALLQKMLEETENRLALVRLLDGGEIAKRLGAVTGAEQRISSVGFNVQGPSLPGVQTKTTAAGTEETLTLAQANPPTATAPPATTSLPSSFNVSASDILNEQMQLSFEVANLRLLVGGSLSDYFVKTDASSNPLYVKTKTTLGFPITIIPDKRHKEAVAIVEVEVQTGEDVGAGEPPAITALLPREKTYNVATITDKSTSIQGGVVTQVVGVGGSWLRGHKTHYLVQDQDTLALSFQPETAGRTGFLWQFRPVLGRDFVKAGQKHTFVQIAFPTAPDPEVGEIGKVHIRTYWRKYDRKKGVLKEIIPNSLKEFSPFEIPRYKQLQPHSFDASSLEDIGNGQILVRLRGHFLPGTFVRMGAAAPEVVRDYSGIRFIASASDLATKKVALVSHDGTEVELKIEHKTFTNNMLIDSPLPQIVSSHVTTVDDANSQVTLGLAYGEHFIGNNPPLVMVIGGKVFGYSDAPLQRDKEKRTLSAVVPTALLIASPEIIVKPLFAPIRKVCPGDPPRPCRYEARTRLDGFDFLSRTERLTPIEQDKEKVMFLLQGNRLNDIQVIVPKLGKPENIGGRTADQDTLRTVTLTLDQIKAHKHLVLQRYGERPFMVAIPSIEIKPPKPIQATERVVVNADEVVLEGDGLGELEGAKYKDRKLTVQKKDGVVTLTGLRLQGVTEVAMTRTIDLTFKNGKTGTVKIDIVNSKVEQVSK